MKGAELESLKKGCDINNVNFPGEDDPVLHLSENDIKWWRDAKFGPFIHWGVYAVF